MTFRVTNIIAVVALVLLILANVFVHAPWWGYVLLVLGYTGTVFWGCATISSDFFLPIVCSANTNEQVVTLTFDDGPHPIHTTRILDVLKSYEVRATFFCIGKNIKGKDAIISRMKEEGHIIANHSYSHDFWFDMFNSTKMLGDMRHTDREVLRITGSIPKFFRPPYGVTNPNVRRAISAGGYIPVGWSIRSMDTVAKDKGKLMAKVMGNIKNGDIILLHDSMEITADILPELIDEIGKKGFRIIPLSKMINVKPYV